MSDFLLSAILARRWPFILVRQVYFCVERRIKSVAFVAFLGFYTRWLLWPTITGIVVMLYGTFNTGDDMIVQDLCDEHHGVGARYGCPICKPPSCEFERLAETCGNAEWDYRMDNEATPVSWARDPHGELMTT